MPAIANIGLGFGDLDFGYSYWVSVRAVCGQVSAGAILMDPRVRATNSIHVP